MHLTPATEADYSGLVELANIAYRAQGTQASWNVETGIIEGDRLTLKTLQADLAASPHAHLLLYRETPDGPPMGSVWLEPKDEGVWYLGLLTIHPTLQNQHLGRHLLAAAEHYAQQHGAHTIRMTVLNVRDKLIAWYQRRGYHPTGQTQPYPYHDNRFGTPLRNDLCFIVLEKKL